MKRAVVVFPLLPVIATDGMPDWPTRSASTPGWIRRAIMPGSDVPPPRPSSRDAVAALLPAATAAISRDDQRRLPGTLAGCSSGRVTSQILVGPVASRFPLQAGRRHANRVARAVVRDEWLRLSLPLSTDGMGDFGGQDRDDRGGDGDECDRPAGDAA